MGMRMRIDLARRLEADKRRRKELVIEIFERNISRRKPNRISVSLPVFDDLLLGEPIAHLGIEDFDDEDSRGYVDDQQQRVRDLDDQIPVRLHLPAPLVVHELLYNDPRNDPKEWHDLKSE